MVRKLLLVFGLFFLASFPAQAQDTAEVFGGYSYMHFHTSLSGNVNGGEIAGQYKFTDWLGGVADFDGHYGSSNGIGTSTHTYLFGPQISLPSHLGTYCLAERILADRVSVIHPSRWRSEAASIQE